MTEKKKLERVTINLIPRAAEALALAVDLTQDSKTDTINHAIQIYSFLMSEVISNGKEILICKPGASHGQRIVLP